MGKVTSRWLRAALSPFPSTLCLWTNWPVRKLARAGEQSGVVTNALRKATPSAATRSIRGVLATRLPVQLSASHRRSSTRMNTMLGRDDFASSAAPDAAVDTSEESAIKAHATLPAP